MSDEQHLRERIATLEAEVKGQDKALAIQSREYERRLQDLNHSHEQAVERYAQFLPREIYEGDGRELRAWRRIIDDERAMNTGQRSAYLSMFSFAMSVLALGFVAYGLWR